MARHVFTGIGSLILAAIILIFLGWFFTSGIVNFNDLDGLELAKLLLVGFMSILLFIYSVLKGLVSFIDDDKLVLNGTGTETYPISNTESPRYQDSFEEYQERKHSMSSKSKRLGVSSKVIDRKCTVCNNPLEQDWQICPICGAGKTLSCSKCGERMEPSWVACPGCGKEIRRQCETCHAELEAGWNSCPYCES